MPKYIDAEPVLKTLSDYALQESPTWGANGYGNQDAYEAILECIKEIEAQPAADVQILSSILAELTRKERRDRYHVWTTNEVKQWIADKIEELKDG